MTSEIINKSNSWTTNIRKVTICSYHIVPRLFNRKWKKMNVITGRYACLSSRKLRCGKFSKKLQLLKVTLEAGSCAKKRKFTAQWYKGSFGLQLLSALTTSVWSVLTFNCKGLNLEMCVLFWCLWWIFHGIIWAARLLLQTAVVQLRWVKQS